MNRTDRIMNNIRVFARTLANTDDVSAAIADQEIVLDELVEMFDDELSLALCQKSSYETRLKAIYGSLDKLHEIIIKNGRIE